MSLLHLILTPAFFPSQGISLSRLFSVVVLLIMCFFLDRLGTRSVIWITSAGIGSGGEYVWSGLSSITTGLDNLFHFGIGQSSKCVIVIYCEEIRMVKNEKR